MAEIKIVRSVPFTGCTGCEDFLTPEPPDCDNCGEPYCNCPPELRHQKDWRYSGGTR